MSLIEKLGIENAKALDVMLHKHAVPENWKISVINGMWQRSSVGFTHGELRAAIADHDTKPCLHGYDIACLICGFGTKDGKRVWSNQKNRSAFEDDRTDHVSDIRNHIAPTTRVIER